MCRNMVSGELHLINKGRGFAKARGHIIVIVYLVVASVVSQRLRLGDTALVGHVVST